MTDPQLGHIGYSPDYRSAPDAGRILTDRLASGDPRVPPPTRASALCVGCGKVVPKKGQRCRNCYDERLRDLIWRNRGLIDFTGFEDIQADIERAERGG